MHKSVQHDSEVHLISDDESFGSDFGSAAEEVEHLSSADEKDRDDLDSSLPTPKPRSNSLTVGENLPRSSTSSAPSMCVVCYDAPASSVGPDVYPTCGKGCASKLQALSGLPNQSHARTPGPPHNTVTPSLPQASPGQPNPNCARTSGRPDSTSWSQSIPQIFSANLAALQSWSFEPTTYANQTRSQSRPNQLRMCNVCHVRPRCQRGGRIYPTCGLSCAAKMQAPESIEMCDYCKKRPKVVINGQMFPQCGKTCRDKAKLAETAANAAACTSCILCWKSTKAGQSDFCSQECHSLANAKAPFLIEIPRGHVAFKKVAERFTSGWLKSKKLCPTVKRVYMVVIKPSFRTSFDKYRTKITTWNVKLQRKGNERISWLVISRECGFGDPGDLEPCSSNKCLLCCIVRSSFSRFDFPMGITRTSLNRAVELYEGGKKSSSKIAALANVLVGREAEVTPQEVHTLRPIPPQGSDAVHIIGVRSDGSRVDLDDIIVYDGDAVMPLYLISYE